MLSICGTLSQKNAPWVFWISGIAFSAVLVPTFLTMAPGWGYSYGRVLFDGTSFVGALCGAIILFVFRNSKHPWTSLLFETLIGTLLLAVSFVLPPVLPESLGILLGLFRGCGATLLAAGWLAVIPATTFYRSILVAGIVTFALACIDQLLWATGSLRDGLLCVLSLMGAAVPLYHAYRMRKTNDGCSSSQANSLSVIETNKEEADEELHSFLTAGTIPRSLISVLRSSAFALAAFVLYSVAVDDPFQMISVSSPALGLTISSVVVIITGVLARRKDSVIPFLYWVAIPFCALFLIVLDAFPLSSPFFLVGASGIALLFSTLSIFAVTFALVRISGDLPACSLATALMFASIAVAGLLGVALCMLFPGTDTRGQIMLVICTIYMGYLLFAPALTLWRSRRSTAVVADDVLASEDTDLSQKAATEFSLTPRETEVLALVLRGYNSPYIAQALFVSDSTVRSHLKSIYRKTGTNSRMDLIELLRERS